MVLHISLLLMNRFCNFHYEDLMSLLPKDAHGDMDTADPNCSRKLMTVTMKSGPVPIKKIESEHGFVLKKYSVQSSNKLTNWHGHN